MQGAIIYWEDDTPKNMKRIRDIDFMENSIPRLFINTDVCICEKANGIPGSSALTSFNFGYNVGRMHQSILQDSKKLILISQKEWRDIMYTWMVKGISVKKKNSIVANNLYHSFLDMRNCLRPEDEGVQEALLIGHYYWHYLHGVI
jgi:hypothetical protein